MSLDRPSSESSERRHLTCSLLSMDNQTLPRDDDPSGMTDFEKNAASEELERFEQLEQEPDAPVVNQITQECKSGEPDKRP